MALRSLISVRGGVCGNDRAVIRWRTEFRVVKRGFGKLFGMELAKALSSREGVGQRGSRNAITLLSISFSQIEGNRGFVALALAERISQLLRVQC